MSEASTTNPSSCPTQSITCHEVCPSCSTSTALISSITAIVTALLATIIFILVHIVICKFQKFSAGRGKPAASTGEEVQESRHVAAGGVEESLAVVESLNTYERKERNTIQLYTKNESIYASLY